MEIDMNRIEKAIDKLCPHGVEYAKLNRVCQIYDGTHSTPNYTDYGVKFVSVENINDLYSANKYISEEDYRKFKIKPQKGDVFMTRIGSIGACAVVDREEPLAYYVSLALLKPNKNVLNGKFLKYAIESLHGRKELRKKTLINAVPIKINKEEIGKITIPLPPLPIQNKIVHFLDSFSAVTTEHIAKLSEELSARSRQYEYYKNKLLSFNNIVEWTTLGEVGKICMCKRIMKAETSPKGDVPFYKIGTFGKKADAYISWETFEKYKKHILILKRGIF